LKPKTLQIIFSQKHAQVFIGIMSFLGFMLCNHAWGQLNLSGYVLSEENAPIPSASVFIKETMGGTATDANGRFLLDIPAPGTWRLRASFVGFGEQVLTLEADNEQPLPELIFRLREKTAELEGLIVRSLRANRNTPMTFLNLSQEELAKNNLGQDVPFVLRWTPSVVATSDAGNGVGYTGIRIRGVDPTRINVTINGIPYNDAESQGVF